MAKLDMKSFLANLKRNERERRKREKREGSWLDEYEQIARISYYFRDNKEKDVQPTIETAEPKSEPEKQRGMKAGTAERVTEFHRLVKSGMSLRQAKGQSHCDPDTYYKWCQEVTGEDPITPYR